MPQERDYLLGTHDAEIDRLGLQHLVWRAHAHAAWSRAGFNVGQTLIDVGCGPGYASTDLAELVGPSGRIIAIDRSRRFLDSVEAKRTERRLSWIKPVEQDLDDASWPAKDADGAWARWVFAFVRRPKDLLARVASSLKPGGRLVVHEYFDYETWRLAPRREEFEEFVRIVIESWRGDGGEPDIGLSLPQWMQELGLQVQSLRPIVEIIPPSHLFWQWPKAFVRVGIERLTSLGLLSSAKGESIQKSFDAAERDPRSLLITPGVLEIIAVRGSAT